MLSRPTSSAIRSLALFNQPCPLSLRSTQQCASLPRAPPLAPPSPGCRTFHTAKALNADVVNHYEILGVTPDVSKSDLKKRFYTLSKETHPDINPDNPRAAERFSEVSEAYATLGNDEKRRIYDRDVLPRFTRSSSSGGASAGNRNRSGTYAGSRPATGLSKRRGTFRGPPPSFYSQGGRDAHVNAEEFARREQESYDRAAQQGGNFEAGQWDPIFNPTPVYRTQTAEDARRQSRRAADEATARAIMEDQSNFWARFIIVSGIIAFGVGIGTMVNRMNESPRGGLVRADGSRRGTLAAER